MNILIVSNYFPPHFKGGYEISCKDMADFLYQKGEQITVLTGDYSTPASENSDYKVIRQLKYIDYNSEDYFNKSQIEKFNYSLMLSTLDEIKPDIVYFWNQQYISIGPMLACRKKRHAAIYDIGDVWPEKYYRAGIKAKAKQFVKSLLPGFIDGKLIIDPVIILSNWMNPIFKEKFKSKSIHVIPRGVEIPKEVSVKNNEPVVRLMSAGRIEPLKGVDIIINSLAKLKDLNWVLDLYGTGDESYLKSLKKLIKELKLENRIFLRGKIFPLNQAYDCHDVFLFPTLAREGFGRVVIESMAYGLTVLSVDRFGPNDIIDHMVNGLKCDPNNEELFTQNLKQIIVDVELRRRISKNALDTIQKKYEINYICNQRYELLAKYRK